MLLIKEKPSRLTRGRSFQYGILMPICRKNGSETDLLILRESMKASATLYMDGKLSAEELKSDYFFILNAVRSIKIEERNKYEKASIHRTDHIVRRCYEDAIAKKRSPWIVGSKE